MPSIQAPPIITCFLLKVASRCNINCDYCYMYRHLDQSFTTQPKFMSSEILEASVSRISEYVHSQGIKRIAVVYHGGEPLLLGIERILSHVNSIRKSLGSDTTVDFSLQTNGVLLTEQAVALCEASDVQISLSLDGPKVAQDRHRLDHRGDSTFSSVLQGLEILKAHPKVFSGVIAVIDPANDPKTTLDFFADHDIPQLDFLLPDANHLTPPPKRQEDEDIYVDWLIECFDYWFDNYPELKIRTFDGLMSSILGCPSETDGFGLGDVSLITVETDGSYHDLDVLKITGGGTTLNVGSVLTASIAEASQSAQISTHRQLLSKEGLGAVCRECDVLEICGGGAVPHRYGENGFLNSSVYCHELKSLIKHIDKRLTDQMQNEKVSQDFVSPTLTEDEIRDYELLTGLRPAFERVLSHFKETQANLFRRALDIFRVNGKAAAVENILAWNNTKFARTAINPSVVAWTDVTLKASNGTAVHDIDGTVIPSDADYLDFIERNSLQESGWPSLQLEDHWLRLPFGKQIIFERELTPEAYTVIKQALRLIEDWNKSIVEEMHLISPEVQFIRDPSAHEDKIVSFSDNSVPGALYVQLRVGQSFVAPEDLADSIIHEHRHQRLYLFQRVCPIVNNDFPLVKSPWREELRPPTGLFHALYVFVELFSFWNFLKKNASYRSKAEREVERIGAQLSEGFTVLEQCDLTSDGRLLLSLLKEKSSYER